MIIFFRNQLEETEGYYIIYGKFIEFEAQGISFHQKKTKKKTKQHSPLQNERMHL